MADDMRGFRFGDFDEMIFKDEDDAARDAAQKLMQDVGFGGMNQTKAPGIVEVKAMQSPDDQFEVGFAEGADFMF
ncbi:hypothetical protein [Gymnodinialimonas sp.]